MERQDVTLQDVADAAKVGLATASRALRDDPATAAKTRERVKKIAAELGYCPDPSMSRLIERRWHGRRSQSGINLGYLYHSKCNVAEELETDYLKYKAPAAALGHSLIRVDLSEFTTLRGLQNRLDSQGIKGLVLPLLPDIPFDIAPVLEKLAAVSLGISSYEPECPVIMHDEFFCTYNAWRKVKQKGYNRIGFVLPDYPQSSSTHLRLGAALVCQQETARKHQIPVLSLKEGPAMDYAKFCAWREKHQPDVLLSYSHDRVEDLQRHGLVIPGDIPFATSNLWDLAECGNLAGYFRDNLQLFKKGVLLLDMMIRSGTPGARHADLVELVKGRWVEGISLPDA